MASVTISAGAELDIASGAELRSATKSILSGNSRPKPLYLRRSAAAFGDGTNPLTVSVGTAPVGSMWELDSVVMYGSDDHTLIPNLSCAFYGGNRVSPALSMLILPGVSIAGVFDFPDGCWLNPGESLFFITSSAVTSGQQVGCNVLLREWLQSDVMRGASS